MIPQKQTVLQALYRMRGDDLYRARIAFKNLSEKELDSEYGQSGQTCREILAGYEAHEKKINDAVEWVKSL